jgi:hypothetical protein
MAMAMGTQSAYAQSPAPQPDNADLFRASIASAKEIVPQSEIAGFPSYGKDDAAAGILYGYAYQTRNTKTLHFPLPSWISPAQVEFA